MKKDELLKATALLYLKDALVKQEYESCAELLGSARNFGAEQGEIDEVIALSLRKSSKEGGKRAVFIKACLPAGREGK